MLPHRPERRLERFEKLLGMRAVVTLPLELLHDPYLSRNEHFAQQHVAAGKRKGRITCPPIWRMLRDHEARPGFLEPCFQFPVYSIIQLDAISGAPHSR
jgi:hypothetical protein